MAKARASKGLLVAPHTMPNESEARRKRWIADASAGFVSPSPTNRLYYSVILKALWPEDHGIPGPILTEKEIRAAIDAFRAQQGLDPYKDVFRRLRELQGEEGFTSIRKEGTRYQLQSLDIGPKREPRTKPTNEEWKQIKEQYGHRCIGCGQQEPDVRLSPDHKIPRSRNGPATGNWQPLCESCNNRKSNACQGCNLNCYVCSWAFPESYKPIIIGDDNKELARRMAEKRKVSQSDLVNEILRDYFNRFKP